MSFNVDCSIYTCWFCGMCLIFSKLKLCQSPHAAQYFILLQLHGLEVLCHLFSRVKMTMLLALVHTLSASLGGEVPALGPWCLIVKH